MGEKKKLGERERHESGKVECALSRDKQLTWGEGCHPWGGVTPKIWRLLPSSKKGYLRPAAPFGGRSADNNVKRTDLQYAGSTSWYGNAEISPQGNQVLTEEDL